jgi:hypothetical protein
LQVGWEFFSVGQLVTGTDGRVQCAGGHVTQVDPSTSGRQAALSSGGAWCGEGFGQPVTTSEGKWLQLQLNMNDVMDLSRFRFDLTYRFVSQPPESLPAGSTGATTASPAYFYGDPVPGTVCSRNLHSCDQQQCVIQSPNFPGLYPRSVNFFKLICKFMQILLEFFKFNTPSPTGGLGHFVPDQGT